MAIDRNRLLMEEKLWLPASNALTDTHMNSINESVITNQVTADDSIHFAEALCKGLKALAFANKAKFDVDFKGTKREKLGDAELEKFESTSANPWGDFIKSLPDICPIFGYTEINSAIGMAISPSDAFTITDEPNASDLITLNINTTTDADGDALIL